MPEPPRPAQPLDYRPHSEDAKGRRWPPWTGLALATVVSSAALFLLMRAGQPGTATPATVYIAPATQPAWPTISVSRVAAPTQPTTDQSPEP